MWGSTAGIAVAVLPITTGIVVVTSGTTGAVNAKQTLWADVAACTTVSA
jgi:hypothetical protein